MVQRCHQYRSSVGRFGLYNRYNACAFPQWCGLTQPSPCTRCNNLVQNPSFETDLSNWETSNVTTFDSEPFEGTQAARMGPGIASMYQDVSLAKVNCKPLFFSFNVVSNSSNQFNGDLLVEVFWLDAKRNIIATGLSLFIRDGRINGTDLTYFDITDRPPCSAAWARLQFSKSQGTEPDVILIDQVILAPLSSINLVQNPGFEAGLSQWITNPDTSFESSYAQSFAGGGRAITSANGVLSQDVYIGNQPMRSTFLLSFAATANGDSTLTIQVQWLDSADNPIGSGLNLLVPIDTLGSQFNYLSYLDITDPAPYRTVKARISFTAAILEAGTFVAIDQVIFARTATGNLVTNPSFENSLNDWEPDNTTLYSGGDVYEGMADAIIPEAGGSLVQDVPLVNAVGRCFLFNCGLGYRSEAGATVPQMLIKVIWLNKNGDEIGLGLSLTCFVFSGDPRWFVYTGITEPAPLGTAAARLQFTKPSSENSELEIDKVVLGRLV